MEKQARKHKTESERFFLFQSHRQEKGEDFIYFQTQNDTKNDDTSEINI